MEKTMIDYFKEVETTREYNGYYYSVSEAIGIVVLGSLCGLKNVSQIHQWAESEKISKFLKEEFAIERIPCYYWLLNLLKLVVPESLNRCLIKWVESVLPEGRNGLTVSLDGKTVRSTEKMQSYQNPLHIVSAQISELGITFASKSVDGKSNEIPAVQNLLKELEIRGSIVVADAMNCQKETAKITVERGADYLLPVKGNQAVLEKDIKDYVQDDQLRKNMETESKIEKSKGRIERRTAFVTTDIDWLYKKEAWSHLTCIGAIKSECERNGEKTEEWHYYISSRALSARELLHHARMEWAVETMHWLLDIHYSEDSCRIQNMTIQKNMNMLRKFALNLIRQYKKQTSSKLAMSKIMFECLMDSNMICKILEN